MPSAPVSGTIVCMNPDVAVQTDPTAAGANGHCTPQEVWVHLLVVLEGLGVARSAQVSNTLPALSRSAVHDVLIALIAAGLVHRTALGDFLVIDGWRERIRTDPCPDPLSPAMWAAVRGYVGGLERDGREVGDEAILPPDTTLAATLVEELKILRRTYREPSTDPAG